MEDVLKENMFAGEAILKSQIPQWYKDRYGVNNLYRYQHPEGCRSCYTLLNVDGLRVCPFVLDFLTHVEYDRVFGSSLFDLDT